MTQEEQENLNEDLEMQRLHGFISIAGSNPYLISTEELIQLNTLATVELPESHGTKSEPHLNQLTHRDFIMSRFLRIT